MTIFSICDIQEKFRPAIHEYGKVQVFRDGAAGVSGRSRLIETQHLHGAESAESE